MKKNNQTVDVQPPAGVLAQFDKLREIMTGTHTEIPRLLQRQRQVERALGLNESAELQGQLSDVVAERERAVRRRGGSIASIMALEPVLQSERMVVEAERQRVAAEAAREFSTRWAQACRALDMLRAEATTLGAALRITFPTPAPYQAVGIPGGDDLAHALRPVGASEPVPLPAHLTALVERLDHFDSALGLVGAIRQGQELTQRLQIMGQNRSGGAPTRMDGLYVVEKAFSFYGMEFPVGAVIDRTLLPDGVLSRYLGRNIRALDSAARVAA